MANVLDLKQGNFSSTLALAWKPSKGLCTSHPLVALKQANGKPFLIGWLDLSIPSSRVKFGWRQTKTTTKNLHTNTQYTQFLEFSCNGKPNQRKRINHSTSMLQIWLSEFLTQPKLVIKIMFWNTKETMFYQQYTLKPPWGLKR